MQATATVTILVCQLTLYHFVRTILRPCHSQWWPICPGFPSWWPYWVRGCEGVVFMVLIIPPWKSKHLSIISYTINVVKIVLNNQNLVMQLAVYSLQLLLPNTD
ncbi:hypothetical protein BDV27DRAFT_27539 [Aspergillus caelatus]|uniref:Uncharacterized protein n=1 Tax=Aspergillus caelatus TaxID=61420 RepID=A0A5N6ZVB6_9EURO|nr:uncharacterized protein BDV27DRAFT_27539 [Aspergillus caelatus]KAE8361554.1 hypothetical protein BDV27DRAFT_27539 [Aspergillus caelatus]